VRLRSLFGLHVFRFLWWTGGFTRPAYVPCEELKELKELSVGARLVVRGGEVRSYADVLLLRCGGVLLNR
jgi:D-ribose pyranose/furanose isomerase RbsD